MTFDSIRERLAGPPCSICGAPVGTAHGYSCPNHNRPRRLVPVMVELPRTDIDLLLAVVEAVKKVHDIGCDSCRVTLHNALDALEQAE